MPSNRGLAVHLAVSAISESKELAAGLTATSESKEFMTNSCPPEHCCAACDLKHEALFDAAQPRPGRATSQGALTGAATHVFPLEPTAGTSGRGGGPRPSCSELRQPGALLVAERQRRTQILVPAHRGHASLGGHFAVRRSKGLACRQAGRSHPRHGDLDANAPVGVADLGPKVDLEPYHHVNRISQRTQVKRVAGLLEVGEVDRVIDVTQRVGIPPAHADLVLEDCW